MRTLPRSAFIAAAFLLTGAWRADVSHETAPRPPLYDVHQHIWSPAAAKRVSAPVHPTVTLPPDLATFVRARSDAAMNEIALRALYTDSAAMLESFSPGWLRGRETIARWWHGNTDTPYILDATAYSVDRSTAMVASYLRDGKTNKIDAHMLHGLSKGRDGKWRIITETLTMGGPRTLEPITADSVLRSVEAAGIQKAVLLSVGYLFAGGRTEAAGEHEKVKAENDWVGAQAATRADRVIAFCSVNPLRSYAIAEVQRCAQAGRFRGIKLHMGNSGVDFRNSDDIRKLRDVFRAANAARFGIVIHLASWGTPYGEPAARVFLSEVLPAASDIPVQIAHLGSPGHLDPTSDAALEVLAAAYAANDPRAKNLWFDLATVVYDAVTPAEVARVTKRIRQIGTGRILYGSDTQSGQNLSPKKAWAAIGSVLGLTDAELGDIADNLPPYAR